MATKELIFIAGWRSQSDPTIATSSPPVGAGAFDRLGGWASMVSPEGAAPFVYWDVPDVGPFANLLQPGAATSLGPIMARTERRERSKGA
jgi:hypothetical protein